jgi:hypothetical protein
MLNPYIPLQHSPLPSVHLQPNISPFVPPYIHSLTYLEYPSANSAINPPAAFNLMPSTLTQSIETLTDQVRTLLPCPTKVAKCKTKLSTLKRDFTTFKTRTENKEVSQEIRMHHSATGLKKLEGKDIYNDKLLANLVVRITHLEESNKELRRSLQHFREESQEHHSRLLRIDRLLLTLNLPTPPSPSGSEE